MGEGRIGSYNRLVFLDINDRILKIIQILQSEKFQKNLYILKVSLKYYSNFMKWLIFCF